MTSRKGVDNSHNLKNNKKANKNMSKRKQELREGAFIQKEMTKEEKLKARKKAYKIWAITEGSATYLRLAEETGLTVHQLKLFKGKDKWEERYEKDKKNGKFKKMIDKKAEEVENDNFKKEINNIQDILDKYSLTDRERLFVMHYLKTFNVSSAAKEAGYAPKSAHVKGHVILKRTPVMDSIKEIRKLVSKNIMIDAHDIIQEYIKIAFADITDYIQFNDQNVTLKDSNNVDGRLITEVKKGKDGVSFKLADKLKALERLEKLFEVMPDRRLELDREKFELTKKLSNEAEEDNKNITIVNDIQ